MPSQCPPCRAYEQELRKAAAEYPPDSNVVIIVSNHNSFPEGTNATGATRFPITVIAPKLTNDRLTYEFNSNWQTQPLLPAIKRPGYLIEGVKQSGPLREIVSQTLKVPKEAVRHITRSLQELLSPSR